MDASPYLCVAPRTELEVTVARCEAMKDLRQGYKSGRYSRLNVPMMMQRRFANCSLEEAIEIRDEWDLQIMEGDFS